MEEEIIIDGVKLIGWPAEIVRRVGEVEANVKGFLSQLAEVKRDVAKLEGKLAKIARMAK
jgi:hypothetical protein